jgi:hypothetical protein
VFQYLKKENFEKIYKIIFFVKIKVMENHLCQYDEYLTEKNNKFEKI